MGVKNVVSIFYPRQKGDTHSGIANIECLNAAVYKQHLKKSARLHHKWVKFQPHPNSLDGSAKPSEETMKLLGFHDINTTLAGTVQALQNTAAAASTSKSQMSREELSTLVSDVVSKENSKLRVEFQSDMTQLKEELRVETHHYVDQIDYELRGALTNLQDKLSQGMQVVKNLAWPAITAPEPTHPPN